MAFGTLEAGLGEPPSALWLVRLPPDQFDTRGNGAGMIVGVMGESCRSRSPR